MNGHFGQIAKAFAALSESVEDYPVNKKDKDAPV